ncbi:MAG: peptidylprolyl isomerase [Candidatus Cloacimonetes bacterium]|nr:peptidylprolyl isomerase [Candidatus Cloacimonadota bacterium]
MRRLLALALLLVLAAFLCAQPVARVGEHDITLSELEEQMDVLYDNSEEPYAYDQLREAALQKLIDESLLMRYANEAGIMVSAGEVDSYFINLYGSHERLMTNGRFDRTKYYQLKRTPEIQAILVDLRRELLVGKTRSILETQFRIGDEALLEQYVLDNFRFDIGYVIINENLADVPPELRPQDAYDWWLQRQDSYQSPRRVSLELLIVADEEMTDRVSVSDAALLQAHINLGLTRPFEEVKDSLAVIMRHDNLRALAQREAKTLRSHLQRGDEVNHALLQTRLLTWEDSIGQLPQSRRMLERAFDMRPHRWSELFDLGWGWAAFQVTAIKQTAPAGLNETGHKVWRDYIDWQAINPEDDTYRDYFYTHIDSFIVAAAGITRVIINSDSLDVGNVIGEGAMRQYYNDNIERFTRRTGVLPFEDAAPEVRLALLALEQHRLATELRQNVRGALYRPGELVRLADTYNLDVSRRVVLLDRFENASEVDDQISYNIDIDSAENTGELVHGNSFVLWRINSIFLNYIPDFDVVRNQVYRLAGGGAQDELDIDYEAYFQQNSSSFQTPDSLALAGVAVPVVADTIQVNEWEISGYYDAHEAEFYTSPRVRADFLYYEDPDGLHRDYVLGLREQVESGMSLSFLQRVFGSRCGLSNNAPVSLADLPTPVKSVLNRLPAGELSPPVFHGRGWYIVRKLADYPSHLQPLEEVRDRIRHKLAAATAQRNAYAIARRVFEQAAGYRECAAYADSALLFETELAPVSDNYPPLGNILSFKSQLMQLRAGEKYSSIVRTDSLVAVIFLRQKAHAHPVTYEEALPRLKQAYAEENRQRRIKAYLNRVIGWLREGEDPARVMPFFGRWRQMQNLTLDSDLPGVEFSSLILAEIPDRRTGEFSPPLRISEDEYLFYRVGRVQHVHKEEFERNREAYRRKLQRNAFNRWLLDYRTQVGVEIF